MSGVYNETYFSTRPEEREREGVLYGVVLVNRKTWQREVIKVGIASGKDWRHVIKRSRGFTNYDLRIQRTWYGSLYDCWRWEQKLHAEFLVDKFEPEHHFGGHTECFKITSKILRSFPKKNEKFE